MQDDCLSVRKRCGCGAGERSTRGMSKRGSQETLRPILLGSLAFVTAASFSAPSPSTSTVDQKRQHPHQPSASSQCDATSGARKERCCFNLQDCRRSGRRRGSDLANWHHRETEQPLSMHNPRAIAHPILQQSVSYTKPIALMCCASHNQKSRTQSERENRSRPRFTCGALTSETLSTSSS